MPLHQMLRFLKYFMFNRFTGPPAGRLVIGPVVCIDAYVCIHLCIVLYMKVYCIAELVRGHFRSFS